MDEVLLNYATSRKQTWSVRQYVYMASSLTPKSENILEEIGI